MLVETPHSVLWPCKQTCTVAVCVREGERGAAGEREDKEETKLGEGATAVPSQLTSVWTMPER